VVSEFQSGQFGCGIPPVFRRGGSLPTPHARLQGTGPPTSPLVPPAGNGTRSLRNRGPHHVLTSALRWIWSGLGPDFEFLYTMCLPPDAGREAPWGRFWGSPGSPGWWPPKIWPAIGPASTPSCSGAEAAPVDEGFAAVLIETLPEETYPHLFLYSPPFPTTSPAARAGMPVRGAPRMTERTWASPLAGAAARTLGPLRLAATNATPRGGVFSPPWKSCSASSPRSPVLSPDPISFEDGGRRARPTGLAPPGSPPPSPAAARRSVENGRSGLAMAASRENRRATDSAAGRQPRR